ncbi:MAG: hypothetical protein RL033_3101, partial [Pseudomonadota bacterium]
MQSSLARRALPPPEVAYANTLAEVANLAGQRLLPINLDVMKLSSTILGALPSFRLLQPRILAEMRNFDARLFDRIERYTMALLHAHALYRSTRSKRESLAPLAGELATLRKQLQAQAHSMTYRGWVDAAFVARIGQQRGHRALASDVLTLATAFRQRWAL